MPDVPTLPTDDNSDNDEQKDLQGYQDDVDTSKRDQFANDNGDDPSDGTPATRPEWREGMRDTEGPDQEGGSTEPTDDSAQQDDQREAIEDADQDSQSVGGDDDKNRPADRW